MSSRAAQLAVELSEKGASQVAGGIDDVTSSARKMGDTVETAGKQAKSAGAKMDTAASGADEMASKGSQAAGAMGGLGDLIGGPFGAAMATGGVGLQAMADSGDLLNAALENSVVASARAKAGTLAKTVADKASAVATKVMTVAQKALNIAQRSSPVLLIVTGVLLLVAAVVLAYKHSDRFRAIVQKAMAVAKAGVDKVVKGFQALGPAVKAVMSFVARVVSTYVGVYVKAFQLGVQVARATWGAIQDVVARVVGSVRDKVTGMRDVITTAWKLIRDKGAAAFRALIAPVQRIVDLVQSLLDKIKSIHVPHVDINPFNGRTSTGRLGVGNTTTTASSSSSQIVTIPVTIQGGATAADADSFMRAVDFRLRSLGKAPVFS